MAKRNVFIDFLVNDQQARAGLKGIGSEAGTTQGRLSNLTGGAKALLGGFALLAGSKIISFLGNAAAAAAEDQKAQDLLALALRNTVDATDGQIESTEKWLKKVSLASGVADDELRPALAELVRRTDSLTEAQDLLGVAMNISAAKGLPLATVTAAIGKAADGNVGALGRMGVAVKDAEGKTMSFEDVMKEANRTMGGATALAAGTAEGRMRKFRVAMDESTESVGMFLLPALGDLADAGSDLAGIFDFLNTKVQDVTGSTDGLWDVYSHFTGLKGLFEGLEWINDQLNGTVEIIPPVETSLGDLATAHHDTRRETEKHTQALQDFEDELRGQIDPMFNLIDAVGDLEDAQRDTADARREYGEDSPEHREALRKEAESWLKVRDAQLRVAEQGGLTRDEYEQALRDMKIFSQRDIDIMLADWDRFIADLDKKFANKTYIIDVNTSGGTVSSGNVAGARSGARARGGPVSKGGTYLVGESGPELLTMGGDGHVTPNAGGNTYITVQGFVGSEPLLAAEIDRMLTRRKSRAGLGFQ